MKKRFNFYLILLLILALFLSGCANTNAPNETERETVTSTIEDNTTETEGTPENKGISKTVSGEKKEIDLSSIVVVKLFCNTCG